MEVSQGGSTDATSAGAFASTVPGQVAAGLGLKQPSAPNIGNTKKVTLYTDEQYLEFFERCFKEAMADRWIFERQWTRAIHYINNRQWLAPYSRSDGWRDARLAKGIPTPVTNKAKEADQTIRSMLAAINFGVIVRPAAQNSKSIATAQAADNMAPLMHDLHSMDDVLNEGDFWFVNCGNVVYHTYWDYDARWGAVDIRWLKCASCGLETTEDQIALAKQLCPACKQPGPWSQAVDQQGAPRVEKKFQGCGQTVPLSLLELAFPLQRPRFDLVPFVVRMRWRAKREFEENATWKEYIDKIKWSRTPTERSLQIFQTLPIQNDMGSNTWSVSGSTSEEEGVAEYELWHRQTQEHPEGLVVRVWGDGGSKIVAHCEDEGLPGDIPYKDTQGRPLFTFTHAGYSHVGGRVIASGVHDSVFKKYDQLNRLDALVEMIAMRMASPQWMIPKGAEVEWLGDSPGLPGLLLMWNSQLAGENGRPERSPGIAPDAFFASWRKQIIEDIEENQGTYDLLRGAKPAGVEAFAAMQLLVERGESRFASAFKSRGRAYRDWFSFAIELERQFGPNERILASLTPAKGYAFETFKKANLQGDVSIVIEDGTYTPKTSLGERAAIEHLNQMQVLPKDPDTTYVIFRKFGMTGLVPALDAHVSAALGKQEKFENWVQSDQGLGAAIAKSQQDKNYTPTQDPTYPLIWRRWYDPQVHRQEFLKWANGDSIQTLLTSKPQIAGLLEAHLMEIDLAISEKMQGMLDPGGVADQNNAGGNAPPPQNGNGAPPPKPPPGGAGRAMANSNGNATTTAIQPGGAQDGRGGAVATA